MAIHGKRATILIATADNCIACTSFKAENPGGSVMHKLINILKANLPNVVVKHIHAKGRSPLDVRAVTDQIHPQIYTMVTFFPTMLVLNNSVDIKSAELQGIIYGSAIQTLKTKDGNEVKQIVNVPGVNLFNDPNAIMRWIKTEIQTNPKFDLKTAMELAERAAEERAAEEAARRAAEDAARRAAEGKVRSLPVPPARTQIGMMSLCLVGCDEDQEYHIEEW